jgi:hypothetical protein
VQREGPDAWRMPTVAECLDLPRPAPAHFDVPAELDIDANTAWLSA